VTARPDLRATLLASDPADLGLAPTTALPHIRSTTAPLWPVFTLGHAVIASLRETTREKPAG